LDLMVDAEGREQARGMPRSAAWSSTRRDADNELYEFGCNLVEAAAEICRVAASPEAAPAIPALLGCVEAALHELSRTSAALQHASQQQDETAANARGQAAADRLQRGYTNLSVALKDARAAARAARSLAARNRSDGAARRRAAG
jgi:hypothetical protein